MANCAIPYQYSRCDRVDTTNRHSFAFCKLRGDLVGSVHGSRRFTSEYSGRRKRGYIGAGRSVKNPCGIPSLTARNEKSLFNV